jgi:hypothetical protein
MASYTENFTGSDDDALNASNWSDGINGGGTMEMLINTNAARPFALNTDIGQCWVANTFTDAQYAVATLVALTSGAAVGVSVRCSPPASSNRYYAYVGLSGDRFLIRNNAGAVTALGHVATGASVSDLYRLEANGATLTAIRNGSTDTDVGPQTDATFSDGAPGVAGYNTSTAARVDDWEGGDLGGATSLLPSNATNRARRILQTFY